MQKPTFTQLLDWLEGRLEADEARAVAQRLESADAGTAADLAWLRAFLADADTVRRTTPPPETRLELVRKFEAFTRDRPTPSILERLVAVLTFDSAAGMALAGARSVQAEGKQRQLIYETDLAEIALNIFPSSHDETLTLNGQIYPRAGMQPGGLSVQIIDPDRVMEIGLTVSDELGEFTLEGIPPGRYGVFISSEGFEIALPVIYLQR